MIPYGKQDISQADIEAVVEVLQSDFLTQGPKVPQFESALASYCNVRHAVAVNSATSALHLACLSLGLGEGHYLWTTPISFVASANCGLYCGAKVDFVDIDARTYNLCPQKLADKLAQAEVDGKLPKVLVCVHLSGQSCDMREIHKLSREYKFSVIEDASHAIGGRYENEPIGNCKYSDITIFSFHPVKVITTAEGGVATTNSDVLNEKMDLLRSHGVTRNRELMTNGSDGSWYYQQIELGFNYRMTELQAALGVSQFERLDEFVARRHELAIRYNSLLADLPVKLPFQEPEGYSAMHLYIIRLELDKINKTHRQVFECLRNKGIGVNLHYIPIHTQPYYQSLNTVYDELSEAKSYYKEAISLPLHPNLSEASQNIIVSALVDILR